MKKTLLLSAMIVLHACAHAQTLRKVLLEQFTCVKTGWCGEGALRADTVRKTYQNHVIVASLHQNYFLLPSGVDTMAIAEGKVIFDSFKVTGYPLATIDRKFYSGSQQFAMNRDAWNPASVQRFLTPAIASVSFTNALKYPNGHFEADVNIVFNTLPKPGLPVTVQVYVLEDSIAAIPGTAFEQANAKFSFLQGGQTPLQNWYHNNVVRAALGGAWGFTTTIPSAPAINVTYQQHISFTSAPGWSEKNLRLVAFISYGGVLSADEIEVLNAEEMALPSFIPSGVTDIKKAVNILNTYPNPALVNDVMRIEYSTATFTDISLEVYNMSGQLVAVPYRSKDAAGIHTIRWCPASYNLVPGVYTIVLGNGKDLYRQQVSIR